MLFLVPLKCLWCTAEWSCLWNMFNSMFEDHAWCESMFLLVICIDFWCRLCFVHVEISINVRQFKDTIFPVNEIRRNRKEIGESQVFQRRINMYVSVGFPGGEMRSEPILVFEYFFGYFFFRASSISGIIVILTMFTRNDFVAEQPGTV